MSWWVTILAAPDGQLRVREWVALASALSMMCVIVVVGRVLVPRVLRPGWREEGHWARGALGWFTLVSGCTLRLMWIWPLLMSFIYPDFGKWIVMFWPVDVLGGMMTVVGSVCVVREYSADGSGQRASCISVAVIVLGSLLPHLYW